MSKASNSDESRSKARKPKRSSRSVNRTPSVSVDKLKQLHDTAQQFEKLQKSLLKTPGQAYYVYHHPTHRFLVGEAENAALYGYTVEEVRAMPQSWASTHHPSDLQKIAAATEKFLNSGPKARPMELQLRVLRKDGNYEWISLHRKALERDQTGRVTTELGVARVITREIEAIREMRDSEDRYRTLFDEVPVPILLIEASGGIVDANRAAYRELRVRSGALKGRNLDQIVTHADLTTLRAELRKLKHGRSGPRVLESRWCRDDGSTFPVEMTFSAMPESGLLVTTRDLSDRESQQQAVEQKEECYRGLFLNNRTGVAVVDMEGTFLDLNPAFEQMIDMSRDQLMGLVLPDVVTGASKSAANQFLRRTKRSGEDQPSFELELRIHGNGETLPVEVMASILEGETTPQRRAILIFHDIRPRKRAEAALEKESALSQVLLDNAPIAIALLSPQGEVIRFNATAEKLFGYTTEEVTGKVLWDVGILDTDEIPRSKKRFQELTEGAPFVRATFTIRNKEGEARIVDAETTALWAYGIGDFVISTAIDITDRRRLESEVIRVAEAEQIRIGHDLHDGVGQTLTGIGVLIGALEESLDGEAKADAARIRELVTEAIGENRRISHGLSPAAVKNRGLAGGLRLLAETVRKTFRTQCECELDPNVGWLEEEHAIHAYRIAQEAVSNAIRHGLAKKIRIRLILREPGRCGLEISDNGTGFKTSDLKDGSGGIGVRVMHYRADLIGGELALRSSPDKGTKIILEMLCGKPRNVGLTSENSALH